MPFYTFIDIQHEMTTADENVLSVGNADL